MAAGARVERALEILGSDAPEHLTVAGRLRIEHRQASLEELGQLANPPLTKGSSSPASSAPGPSTTVHYSASVVAQAKVPSVPVFDTSTATTPSKTLPSPQPSGSPLVFLVQGSEGSRLHVLLPIRPNGSTGWIERADVSLSQHDYRILVALGAHTITVLKGTETFLQEPIGVATKEPYGATRWTF